MCLSSYYVSRLIMLSVTNEIILGRDKKISSPGSFSRQSSYDGWRWSSISHILSSFTKVVLTLMAIMMLKRVKCLSKYFQFSIFTFCVSVTKAIINAKLPTLISIGHAQLCRSKSKYFLWRQIVSQSPYLFLAFWQSFLLLSIICVWIIWLSKL